MSTKSPSKGLRAAVGAVVGAIVGLTSPVGPAAFGILGGLIGYASATSSARDPQRGFDAVRSFLATAHRDGDIDEAEYQRLMRRLWLAEHGAAVEAPVVAAAPQDVGAAPRPQVTQPPVTPPPPPQSVPTRGLESPPAPKPAAPPVRPPRRPLSDVLPVLRPIRAFWESLRADFGVQGLGSLGVLLVFTATLGFVIFAFSEVGATFRPVAELMVPLVLFGMSRFLRRRSAPFMAAALEGLGGAVTPIMAFAAFTDGAPIPPDVERAALVAALAATSLALASAYAWSSLRRPDSPLRFLVAPLVWVAVGVVGMAFHEEASAALFALVLVAIGATPWVLAKRSDASLARAATATVVPGLGIAYTLLLVFGYAEAWPLWPMVFGGLAAISALEGARHRIPRVWIGEAAVVAVTGLALAPGLDAAWAGAAVVFAAALLMERWALADAHEADAARVSTAVFGSLVGAGLMASAAGPGALLTAGIAITAWSHVRRLIPVAAFSVGPAVVGAVAPALAAIGLGWLTSPWIGLLAIASAALVVALASRVVVFDDAYLAVGVLIYAGFVGLASGATDVVGVTVGNAIALAVAAVGVAVVPRRLDVRIWLSTALGVAGWLMLSGAVDFGAAVISIGLAGAGLSLVAVGLAVRARPGGHLALAGHVVGAVALPFVIDDPLRIAALGMWLVAWIIEVASEPVGSPLQRLVGDRATFDTSWIAPAPILVGLPLLGMAVVAEARPSAGDAGVVFVLAAGAVIYGAVAGLPVWRRALTMEAVVAGNIASVIAVVRAAEFDPLVASRRPIQAVALAAGIIGVVASGKRVRAWMHWYAWGLSLPLGLLAGLAAGLDASDLHWIAIGWGAIGSVGALVADDVMSGRRSPYRVGTPWLVPPVVLGSAAALGAIALGIVAPIDGMWPVAVAAVVWTAAMAWLLRSAPITFLTWTMGSVAYVSGLYDAGFDPIDEPLLLTWAGLVLLGAAVALPRSGDYDGRLDLPPVLVGLGVAALAVGSGAVAADTAVTWAPIGAALIIVGVVKREWVALTPLGSVLVVGAAFLAGPWWLTAALAGHAGAAAVTARFQGEGAARMFQWASAALATGAWASLLWAMETSLGEAVGATSIVTAMVAMAATFFVLRNPDPHHHGIWTTPWLAFGLMSLVAGATQAVTDGVGVETRWIVAAAAVVWTVSAVLAATKLDVDELRLSATTLFFGSVAAVGWATDAALEGWATWILIAAVALTTSAAPAQRQITRHGWRNWLMAVAGILHVAGIGLAAVLLPDRSLLILALLAAAGAALVIGFVFELAWPRYLAPGLIFGAWVAFITEAAAVDIQWYAPAFAAAVLIDLEMLRRQRSHRGVGPISTEEMVVVELVALGLAVGPALVQVVVADLKYGLLAILWGTIISVWGTATRVRRRVLVGGVGAALGALLMVAVPLAELLPEFRGAALWAAVFAVGAVLITVAATLEQTRRRIVELKVSFAKITEGWE